MSKICKMKKRKKLKLIVDLIKNLCACEGIGGRRVEEGELGYTLM